MLNRLLVPGSIALMLLLAACGGSSNKSESTTTTTAAGSSPTTAHVAIPVSADPSKSAKMICEDEAQTDIYEQATGVKTTSVTTPTWNDHVYSCDYVYPGGVKIGLSVKELVERSGDHRVLRLPRDEARQDDRRSKSLGQGAFQTEDGSVVVRKDFKVLTIDVSKLPGQFGVPPATRGDVAINVGGHDHGVLDRRVITDAGVASRRTVGPHEISAAQSTIRQERVRI